MARGGPKNSNRGGRGGQRGGQRGSRIGDRVVLNSADSGWAPPTATSGRSARFRQVITGTEEILSSLPEQENVVNKPKVKVLDLRVSTSDEEEPEVDDDPDVVADDDDALAQIFLRKHRAGYKNKAIKELEENSYKVLWTKALCNKEIRTRPDMAPEKEKVSVVQPIPRFQPSGYLNKFARRKIAAEEPQFDRIGGRLQMTFAEKTSTEDAIGMNHCSRVAGEVWQKIFEMPHLYKGLICMQFPNSLKAYKNDNKFQDVRVGDQNVQQIDDSDVSGHRKRKPRYHCLQSYAKEEPFGKIQLLKSGRVIMRIGDRKFDVCTMSKSFDPNVGVIMEFEDVDCNPKASKSGLSSFQDKIYSLGFVNHHFSAFYNYEDVFANADDSVVDETFTAKMNAPTGK